MWVFTNFGFFSVTQNPNDASELQVRSRTIGDITELCNRYFPNSKIVQTPNADYLYRIFVSHQDFSEAISKIALTIDYSNFKDDVAKKQGPGRADIYGHVWENVLSVEKEDPLFGEPQEQQASLDFD